MEKQGIDVSKWQGEIDWPRVAASGTAFAMVRASYGRDSEDPRFKANISGAVASGLPCGAYHYCYAMSVEEAKTEAEFFLRTVKGQRLEYPLALDLEDASLAPLGREMLTAIANAFLQVVEEAGYYAMLYANRNWLSNYLDAEVLGRYDLWLANWTENPTYPGSYGMWQYSSQGRIDGVSGNVDRDVAYKDYPQIIKEYGLNHLEEAETPEPPSPPEEEHVYIVQPGDTLSGIAEQFGTTAEVLAQLNGIQNPNLIYVGQRIVLPSGEETPQVFRPGDSVKIKQSAVRYATGQTIPDWVKVRTDTILQVSGDKALLKNIYSWVYLSDLEQADGESVPSPSPSSEFTVGETVAVKPSATHYATGQAIPDWVKSQPDTILQISGNRALLKNIYSWVLLSDLEPSAETPTPFAVGDTVKIKQSTAHYATGQAIPDWVKGRPDTILQISGDRALLKSIYSWVLLSDLER
ncbi:MAG: GH25 family lysozyme [Oscillospiraceae bacterium]|jgi:GH25 family lysozyme M1 (1,4-beta-N-acetylmuramidase)